MTLKTADRVTFVKFDRRMNYYLHRLVGRDGVIGVILKNKALVDFGIMGCWWINLNRLELRIPCYSFPHVYDEKRGICFHCGEPKK